MSLNKQEFSQYIRDFNFRELFNEMGWNRDKTSQLVAVDGQTFTLQSVAEKSGFKVLICSPNAEGIIPDSKTRKKLETKVRKLFAEHLIIFEDAKKTEQIWQLVVRKTGKPTKTTETRYHSGQDPELLFQRAAGIFFELDEEEHITIVDVTKRITENLSQNAEAVVKRFYTEFSKQHKSFYEFVSGIDDHIDALNTKQRNKTDNKNKQWYVSLMLNRLMFCYFIQKQRFLDDNQNYLREKLAKHQEDHGRDKFYDSFYKTFLMVLFHDGLGAPNHDEELRAEIGKIPYLNGGLFDVHEIEEQFKEIEIEDAAFEKIFNFFDDWTWHLDTRKEAKGKDINPDVIGYIFEKYINDRAQMGAYYTKEDITDYISKNCILPFLFDETKRNYPKAFSKGSELWEMLKSSGDTYIYDAVKHGVNEELPEEIEIGLDTTAPNLLERRKDWNKSAPASHALPTEIWREVVDRRRRYTEVKAKIENGEIESINDFITYNLNITQFAQDVIENTNDPKFLQEFYNALNSVTIIDPTCGSGAFLFAAMNILESLYESCLQKMRNFIEDEDRLNKDITETFAHKFPYFRETLLNMQSEKHPNQQYFIYKNIILHNLYGVDIMKEAVEIAKLRLFLKLVATVEADRRKPNLGLEPLPDIDFNIRAGNTLIGYVSQSQIDNLAALLVSDDDKRKLLEDCDVVARTFKRYKEIQLSQDYDYEDFKLAKHELNVRLNNLNKSLNKTLFQELYEGMNYGQWKDSHQPFHWFAEFYEIIHDKGGFDIIIGNPPYVEYGKKLKSIYSLRNYSTIDCGNLHAYIAERSFSIVSDDGLIGLIVPLPSINTSRMITLQTLIKPKPNQIGRNVWISAYDERPSSLFDGVDQRLIIEIIGNKCIDPNLFTTGIKRWTSSTRKLLFPDVFYSKQSKVNLAVSASILKIKLDEIETNILTKFFKDNPIIFCKSEQPTKNSIYCRTAGGRYWKVVLDKSFGTQNASEKVSYFHSLTSWQSVALISSSTFWWYYSCHFDMFNFKDYMIFGFRFSSGKDEILRKLDDLGAKYIKSLETNAETQFINSKTRGLTEQKQYFVGKSKPIIDEIDKVLAAHYGFSEVELDFIINYDIKYRMGKALDGDSEE